MVGLAPSRKRRRCKSPTPPEEPTQPLAEPEVIEIDPQGDVFFEVRREANKKSPIQEQPEWLKLRVSSKVLSVASKPFAAMLSPRYLEGRNLSVDDPPVIELEDEDPTGMKLLAQVLHHQFTKEMRSAIRPAAAFCLAAAAHKYDCVQAVELILGTYLAARVDLSQLQGQRTEERRQYWALVTALIMDDTESFSMAISNIVTQRLQMWNFLMEWPAFAFHPLIPSTLWILLSEQMEKFRLTLLSELHEVLSKKTAAGWRQLFSFHRTSKQLERGLEKKYKDGGTRLFADGELATMITQFDVYGLPWASMLDALYRDVTDSHSKRCKLNPENGGREEPALGPVRELITVIERFKGQPKIELCLRCVRTGDFHAAEICGNCALDNGNLVPSEPHVCQGCSGDSHKDDSETNLASP